MGSGIPVLGCQPHHFLVIWLWGSFRFCFNFILFQSNTYTPFLKLNATTNLNKNNSLLLYPILNIHSPQIIMFNCFILFSSMFLKNMLKMLFYWFFHVMHRLTSYCGRQRLSSLIPRPHNTHACSWAHSLPLSFTHSLFPSLIPPISFFIQPLCIIYIIIVINIV